MKKILVFGAGKSSTSLINLLLDYSQKENLIIKVCDRDIKAVEQKVKGRVNAETVQLDISNVRERENEIVGCDLVISLLPPHIHFEVAKSCINLKKNLITASYISNDMLSLHENAKKNNLIFLNECGLDPGIDHMSAKKIIDNLTIQGCKIKSFKSYTGGLVAPICDDNPWHYKVTWNPRNVVLAGQGTAAYLDGGQEKYVPYHRLFGQTETLHVPKYGNFEGYPNRDSLIYKDIYKFKGIDTLIRGTLRRPNFCKAWNVLVQLGITDDSYTIKNSESITYKQFTESYIPKQNNLATYFKLEENGEIFKMIEWLGLLEDKPIHLDNATPAQITQKLIEEKWRLDSEDKDMIVMQHQFKYVKNNIEKKLVSSLVVEGTDHEETAMSKTVGYPLAIASLLILKGVIKKTGVVLPVDQDLYDPILNQLEALGIKFNEEVG